MLKIPRFKPIVLPRHVKANPGFRECKLTSHTEERRALALVVGRLSFNSRREIIRLRMSSFL